MSGFALWGARRSDVQVGSREDRRLQERLARDVARWHEAVADACDYALCAVTFGKDDDLTQAHLTFARASFRLYLAGRARW